MHSRYSAFIVCEMGFLTLECCNRIQILQANHKKMLSKKQSTEKTHQEELIQRLIAQNTTVKLGFDNLKKEYQLLRNKYQALCEQLPREVVDQINQKFHPQKTEQYTTNSPRFAGKWDEEIEDMYFEEGESEKLRASSHRHGGLDHERGLQETFMDLRNTNLRLNKALSISERAFPLIEGCFILEKKPLKGKAKTNINQMIEFSFPEDLAKHQKPAIDLMLKYIFSGQEYHKTIDDCFHSRRNEILYGTPYQDYSFAFEDNRWNNKKEIPEVLKQMGTMKKKYYHILVRPEILQKQEVQQQQQPQLRELVGEEGKKYLKPIEKKKVGEYDDDNYFYQTEVVYCVVSSFPLRIFFQDLHRIIQQQLKYRLFNEDITDKVLPRKEKYEIIGEIMRNLQEENYHIGGFPIFHTYHTGVTKLELSIPTVIGYQHLEDQYLRQVLPKYSDIKIIKLLHYVLAQRFIMVESDTRRQLNEIFQILRILIRPFLWIFATVYVYSEYFAPFLSSPMPILVGKVPKHQDNSSQSGSDAEQEEQINTDHAQFLVVRMSEKKDQLKDSNQPFYKAIKRLKKHMDKADDKVELYHKYVNHLRVFIEKGVLDQEPTDFHMEFIDTQMVSYFKDSKNSESMI